MAAPWRRVADLQAQFRAWRPSGTAGFTAHRNGAIRSDASGGRPDLVDDSAQLRRARSPGNRVGKDREELRRLIDGAHDLRRMRRALHEREPRDETAHRGCNEPTWQNHDLRS